MRIFSSYKLSNPKETCPNYGSLDNVPHEFQGSKHRKFELKWHNLEVQCKGNESPEGCKLLRNVSGVANSGELLATMGPSGAAKTTLLNTLTGRNNAGLYVSGTITCNRQQIGNNTITALSAYVQQDDLFFGTLTVREHLIFQFGLECCKDTKIGTTGSFQGISGGEAKRLAFASEILTDPLILFCDEPTTGLDSYMAENIVNVLKTYARHGTTVLCTIHQPASEVYNLFDKVQFLVDGKSVFIGTPGEAIEYFERLGYACPADYNPADFILELLSNNSLLPIEATDTLLIDNNSTDDLSSTDQIFESKYLNAAGETSGHSNPNKITTTNSWMLEFLILFWRSMIINFRDRNVAFAKLLEKSIRGIFVGLIYHSTQYNQEGIMNYNGALFFIIMEFTFPAIIGVLSLIPTDFDIVVREYHNGMYRFNTYFLARLLSFVPVYSLDGIIFMCLSYFLIGFRSGASAFFMCLFIGLLVAQVSVAFGIMFSCIAPTFKIALAISEPIVTLLQMTGGLLTNLNSIPVWLSWIQYISWFKYGFEAVMINQWTGNNDIECNEHNSVCVHNGDGVLNSFGFKKDNLWFDIAMLFAMLVFFYLIAFLALLIRIKRSK